MNRYAYALNNPLVFVDPSGLYCEYASDTFDDDGTLDDVDYGSSPDECSSTGGMWTADASTWTYGDNGSITSIWSESYLTNGPSWQAPSNYEQSLPNCWAVGGKAVLNAVGDTLGPVTDIPGLVKQGVDEVTNLGIRNAVYNATLYSLTTINTKGGVGLLSPWKSSTYRAIVADTATFADIATGASLLYFDYNLVKQIVNEVQNPTPCR